MYTRVPKPLRARMQSETILKMTGEQRRRDPYVPEVRLLQPTFDNSCRCFVVVCHKLTTNDRSADDFGCIDDFLYSWDTKGHFHRRHPSKMERVESHMG